MCCEIKENKLIHSSKKKRIIYACVLRFKKLTYTLFIKKQNNLYMCIEIKKKLVHMFLNQDVVIFIQ